jgi:hypothetical protein
VGKPIPHEEPIVRFIYSKSNFSAAKNIIKPSAFYPEDDPVKGMKGTSVSRISGLSDNYIEAIGQAARPARTFYGWGRILAKQATTAPLHVAEDEPPARHAQIFGWPDEKENIMELLQELADAVNRDSSASVRLIKSPKKLSVEEIPGWFPKDIPPLTGEEDMPESTWKRISSWIRTLLVKKR